MIKFNQSVMHEFQNVFFFQGTHLAKDGTFLFEESARLFGKEVLAPNLLEFQKEDEKLLDFNGGFFKNNILAKIKMDTEKFISLVDIRIRKKMNSEIGIYFDPEKIPPAIINSIQSALAGYTNFKVESSSQLLWQTTIKNIDYNIARYFQVQFSEEFIIQRGGSLSPELQSSFDSNRYVDTQVASFMLMTTISGSSKKTYSVK